MSRIELLLFLVLFTVYSFFIQYPNVNQNTRLDLTRAIVEDRTVIIDRFHENTVDKSLRNGHWYADKAPGLSFLAVPVYALLLAMQPVNDPAIHLEYPTYVLNAFTVALPSALLVVLVLRWLRSVTAFQRRALAVAVAFGLGTLALPYATLFFGHMTSAFFSFAAFYVLWGMTQAEARENSGRVFAAGLLAGMGALVEYPTAAIAVLLALYAFSRLQDRKRVTWYVLGLAPALLVFMAYNTAAFGGPGQLSYLYSPTVQSLGLNKTQLPTLTGLWSVTFGPRGLFVLSPLLLLVFPGMIALFRRRDLRREFWLFTAILAGFLLLACLYYTQLGGVPGPRYVLPALPFAACAVGLALPGWRGPFVLLSILSASLMLIVTATNPMAPMTVADPLVDYWLPGILQRSIVPTAAYLHFGVRNATALGALAAVLALGALGWIAWLRGDDRRWDAVLTVCVVLALVGYVVIGLPIDLRQPFAVPSIFLGAAP